MYKLRRTPTSLAPLPLHDPGLQRRRSFCALTHGGTTAQALTESQVKRRGIIGGRVLKEKSLTTYAPRRFSAFGVEWSANMPVVSWGQHARTGGGRRPTGREGRGGESNRSPCSTPHAHERPPLSLYMGWMGHEKSPKKEGLSAQPTRTIRFGLVTSSFPSLCQSNT